MNPLRSLFVTLSRMPPALMLLIIIGLAVVVTMAVTGNLSETQRQAAQREAALRALYESKSRVVYAAKDIAQGDTITADALQEKEEQVSKIPADAMSGTTSVVGRVAKFGIQSGQIVSSRDLVAAAGGGEFEGLLKPGFRAVTFGVDTNSGVAGFIAPGTHVDVYAMAGEGRSTKANAILSDCQVLAVGKTYKRYTSNNRAEKAADNITNTEQNYSSGEHTAITVQLDPHDVVRLLKGVQTTSSSGSQKSQLYLTLRGTEDHAPIPIVDVNTLFKPSESSGALAALPPPPPGPLLAPPLPPMHQVEVWTGDHRDVISVPQT